MGGHGGLNILPQKKWNVYNFDNREKVRKDEEAAARDEQQKRDAARRRDAEFRIDRLRQARGLPAPSSPAPTTTAADSGHINLFEGLVGFSSLGDATGKEGGDKKFKKAEGEDGGGSKKRRREEEKKPAAVAPEDEKYKLGYGLVGKGVKAPWYVAKSSMFGLDAEDGGGEGIGCSRLRSDGAEKGRGVSGKKTIEELREERMRREKQEHGRERAILTSVLRTRVDRHSSRRDR